MLILYGIANCDTIRKTRAWLEKQAIPYQFHDYRIQGSPESLIRKFVAQFTHSELINTRGTTWRNLTESQRRLPDTDSAVSLMSKYPALIKRPLLQSGEAWLLGYDESRLRDLSVGN